MPIIVSPPWWQTWWAYLLYFLVTAGIVYGVYRFQLQRKMAEQEADRLREMDELKTRLYTNITHEFRTPLTVILGMADEIRNSLPAHEAQRFEMPLNMIDRNGNELLRLVNQMLDLAKAESGRLSVKMAQSDVIPFLKYMVESYESMAKAKGIGLAFQTHLKELAMDMDAEKLFAIVSNLLSNAIKFTSEGEVVFDVDQEIINGKNWLLMELRDTGKGISKNDLPYVFDRFYQVDDSVTQAGEGTGIGLALTKELTELLGGSISVKSQLGEGTTFEVKLPVTRNAQPMKSPMLEMLTTVQASNVGVSHTPPVFNENKNAPVVLIVEDNPDVAAYLVQCLKENYQALLAENGAIGIEKAIEHTPDIIISDVMMPEKDGFELCAVLKKDIRTSHIPIILLTAKATQEDRIAGLQQGADAYLAKPFNKAELFTRLQQLVELRKRLQEKYGSNLLPALPAKPTEDPNAVFLQNAAQAIFEHLDDSTFNAASLAKSLGMGQSNIYKKLKALTGKSTAVYIRSVRLHQARELLRTTHKNVSEIAYETGFNDPAWFSRVFKEEFGHAPSEGR